MHATHFTRKPHTAHQIAKHQLIGRQRHQIRNFGPLRHSRIAAGESEELQASNYNGIHHAGVLCQDISKSVTFYKDVLGMVENEDRPASLPYKGAWLWVGKEMIHLMELPNPDPAEGRPEHGGRDRHLCLSVGSIKPIEDALQKHNVVYTKSKSGRAALFFRDPDYNVLEMAENGVGA